jgi:dienelactone hydrolase
LRSWLRKSVLACATISLLAGVPATAQSAAAQPAIALIDAADRPQVESWTSRKGWRLIAPMATATSNIDTRVQGLEAAVLEATKSGSVDPARIYVVGRDGSAAAVFYAVSRVPELWAAAVALGGSPQPAIDSDRLFTANFTNVPVLWLSAGPQDQTLAGRLKSAGMNLEWRGGKAFEVETILDWLAGHTRAEYPGAIDCETNSPTFARCYWIRMTRFDAAERNDVLPSSRLQATSIAALDLGGFGYKADDPGPGVLVSTLPEKYSGPLKVGDRIVALDGREIADARRYADLMAQTKDERSAVVLVQRGKDRLRIETSIVLPKRAPVVTARVRAKYLPEDHEIQIVSRAVTQMRVTVPRQWVPAVLNWNGVPLERLESPGCRLLTIEKALQNAAVCPEQ